MTCPGKRPGSAPRPQLINVQAAMQSLFHTEVDTSAKMNLQRKDMIIGYFGGY